MLAKTNQFQVMRVLVWALPAYVLMFGIAFVWLGHMLPNLGPPYSASFPTDKLAEHFYEHRNEMRMGFAIGAACLPLWGVWSLGVFAVMRRMEGTDALLSYTQLVGGILTVLPPLLAFVFWCAASFRPEMPPANIQLLYDLGWLTIDLGFAPATIQMIAIGVLFLRDPRPIPLFPKWFNWLGIWLALEFFAEIIMPSFRTGPFAWGGLFNFYIPYGGPFAWLIVLFIYILKAIKRLENEELASATTRQPTR